MKFILILLTFSGNVLAGAYNLNTKKFNLSAELTNDKQVRAVLTKPTMGGEFNGEVVGKTTYLRQKHKLLKNDFASLTFQTQLYNSETESRPAVGIPLDFKLSKKDAAGISAMVDQGKAGTGKYIYDIYYNRKIYHGLSSAFGIHTEKYQEAEKDPLNSFNTGLNYETKFGAKLNVGTNAVRAGKDNVVLNHVMGATFVF